MSNIIYFVVYACITFAKNIYTLNDLQALHHSRSYKEFFNHVQDIRPGARTSKWHAMLNTMLVGRIEELRSTIKVQDFAQLTKMFDEVYNFGVNLGLGVIDQLEVSFEREKWGREFFKQCFMKNPQENIWCFQKMTLFWKQKNSPVQLGVDLGLLAWEFFIRDHEALWEFFKDAYGHSMSNYFCAKEMIQIVLFEKIKQMVLWENLFDKLPMVDALINEVCWGKIKPRVESLVHSTLSDQRLVAHALLKAKGELKSDLEDFFFIGHLLGAPTPGAYFNWSWGRLEALGQDYHRRSQVLKKLQGLDPLPDLIFSLPEVENSKVIIRTFSENFPEYLDLYARKCLDFFSGKVDFPNGNPTPRCRDLFKRVEGTNWITGNLQNRFKELGTSGPALMHSGPDRSNQLR